jgi:hypothetical protein
MIRDSYQLIFWSLKENNMNKNDKKIDIKAGGGPVFMGPVDNRHGKISGRQDQYQTGFSADELTNLFNHLYQIIDAHPNLTSQDKSDIKSDVNDVRQELSKREKADENFIMRRLRNIGRVAPDILEVTLATIVSPALGFGLVAKKIAEKVKASAG